MLATFLISVTISLRKAIQCEEVRVDFGSQFEDTAHHGREGKLAVACGSHIASLVGWQRKMNTAGQFSFSI